MVMGLRLLVLSIFLVVTAFFYSGGLVVGGFSSRVALFALVTAFAAALFFAVLLRRGRTLERVALTQLVTDQITWTAFVYITGGVASGGTSLYGLTCLFGAVLLGLRGAIVAAISGVSAYTLLCVAFVTGILPRPLDQPVEAYAVHWADVRYPFMVNVLGLAFVTLLASYLAERLRTTGGRLAQATARAEEAERLAALGRIAAALAHEIRNPLGSISGSIEMLREAPGLSDEDKKLCDIVHREAGRLNQLVSDMLDLSGPRRPEPENVDVAALAREVVQLASRSERSGSGDVTVIYDGPDGPLFARCDPGQMRQVLWNLVRNGVQATAAGTSVVVAVGAADDRVEMVVRDEGPGISPEASRKIFDAFYTTRSHGAGIGLAVVRRIIDDHAPFGARIEDRSGGDNASTSLGPPASRGRGAEFMVALARTPGPARTGKNHDAPVAVPENTGSRSRKAVEN
jgi:signal transduction histidine kinase